ncbi:MAG: S8 family serine peptidase [Gemmatimonadales bacterium]
MLILLCGLLACRGTPVEPGHDLQRPPIPQGTAVEQGCARLDIRVKGRATITVEDDTVLASPGGSCAGLRPVISGIPVFDRTTKQVRLPVALENSGSSTVRAPARLYGWEDSLIVIEPPGLARNQWTASYLDFVRPDSALTDTAAAFPGAVLWRFDSLLAQGGLAVGDTTGTRWIELAVHSGVHRFEVVFHAGANALSDVKPPVPGEAKWPDDSMHTVMNPTDTVWVYYRTIFEVRFDDSTSGQTINAFIAKYNAQIVGGIRGQRTYIMQFPDPGPTWDDLISRTESLQSEPGVLAVAPLTRRTAPPIFHARYPDDAPGHTRPAWLASPAGGTWSSRAIRAPLAWGCETGLYGGELVSAGIVEYGLEATNRDLSRSVPQSVAIRSGLQAGVITATDQNLADWHGTAVAGVLTAEGDNGEGIAGAIWSSRLTAYSLYSADGHLAVSPSVSFKEDLVPALDMDSPRVLSISVEFALDTVLPAAKALMLDSALAGVLRNTGTLVVLSAGNSGSRTFDIDDIASFNHLALRSSFARLSRAGFSDQIIVVAGTDRNGGIWDGSDVFSGFTDIAAPAAEIDLLGLNRPGTPYSQELYRGSGTSFAAPLVAGVAAQLLAMDPTLTAAQVKDYILRGAQEPVRDPVTGALIDSTQRQIQVPGSGQHLYELDAYGSLTLLARERTNTPICGFPVSTDYSLGTFAGRVLIQRDPASAPVPIITAGSTECQDSV